MHRLPAQLPAHSNDHRCPLFAKHDPDLSTITDHSCQVIGGCDRKNCRKPSVSDVRPIFSTFAYDADLVTPSLRESLPTGRTEH